METIKLREAILVYSARIGVKVKDHQVAEMIFPDTSRQSRSFCMSKLVNGVTKRVDVSTVKRICTQLGVDANFLFGVEPMKKD
jgi:hypothetical protein